MADLLVEFFLHNAFLASTTLLLGGATAYLWAQPSEAFFVDTHTAVIRVNNDNALVVDLRPKADFDKGHIPAARHIESSEIETKAIALAKKRPLLLVCANGAVSTTTARKLMRGDTLDNVTVLKGGMRAWLDANQPTHKKK